MPAAEMPMPCWPRLWRSRWNFEPYRSFAKMGGICWRTMPGPLSVTVMRKRLAWLAGGAGSPWATTSTFTTMSGRIPASSHASRALSTASLTHVSSALRGLSNPSRWRFLVKNSETEMSRWRAPISTAVTVAAGLVTAGLAGAAAGAVAFGCAATFGFAAAVFGAAAALPFIARLDDRLLALVFDGICPPYKQNQRHQLKFSNLLDHRRRPPLASPRP